VEAKRKSKKRRPQQTPTEALGRNSGGEGNHVPRGGHGPGRAKKTKGGNNGPLITLKALKAQTASPHARRKNEKKSPPFRLETKKGKTWLEVHPFGSVRGPLWKSGKKVKQRGLSKR